MLGNLVCSVVITVITQPGGIEHRVVYLEVARRADLKCSHHCEVTDMCVMLGATNTTPVTTSQCGRKCVKPSHCTPAAHAMSYVT